MKNILIKKFEIGSELAKKLMETGDALLVEGNTWRDNIWGVCYCDKCKGYGHNALGEILMKIRTDLLTYG